MSEQLIQDILQESQPARVLEMIQKRTGEVDQETVASLNTLSSQELANGNVGSGYALANYALMAAKILNDDVALTRAMASLVQAEAFAVNDVNDEVINHHQATMNRAESQNLADVRGMVALSLGNYYRRFDHVASAIRWYKNAIDGYKTANLIDGVILGCESLLATGQFAAGQEKMDQAQRALEMVRDLAGELPIPKSYYVTSLVMLGDVYFNLAAQAEDDEKRRLLLAARTQSYERVLDSSEIEKDRADAHQAVAGALRDQARIAPTPEAGLEIAKNAEKHLKTSVQLAEESGAKDEYWRARGFLGDLYGEQGKLKAAYKEYEASLNTIEELRSMARTAEERMLYFNQIKQHFYFAMIDVCLSIGQTKPDFMKKAFYWLEASLERDVLDQLGVPKVNWMEGASKQMLEKLGNAEAELHQAVQPLAAVTTVSDETRGVYVLTSPQQYVEFLVAAASAKALSPAWSPLPARKPSTVAQLQKVLPEGSVFIEYLIVQREVSPHPELLIFAMSKTDFKVAHKTVVQPGMENQPPPAQPTNWLADQIASIRKVLRDRTLPNVPANFGKELYDLALGPIEDIIKDAKHLCIAPYGIMRYLPFEALRRDGRYLVEDCAISYTLSGSTAAVLARKKKHPTPATGKFLGISYFASDEPQLAEFQEQVKQISKSFPADKVQIMEGKTSTEAEAIKAMPQADFIHLGTVAQIVEGAPLFSSVVFAPTSSGSDRLPAYQIQDTAINAELVVMAGNQIGMGYYQNGDELLALISSWSIAGVSSVISSLWLNTAESTTELMKRFYENLKSMPKAEALRQAKVSMIAETDNQHPYKWSPFVLYGGWE